MYYLNTLHNPISSAAIDVNLVFLGKNKLIMSGCTILRSSELS